MKNIKVLNLSVDSADEKVNDKNRFAENFICKHIFVLLLFFYRFQFHWKMFFYSILSQEVLH